MNPHPQLPEPLPPTGPRLLTGTALYGDNQRRCLYCGKRAELFDIDGSWCSATCQTYDRQSEYTLLAKERGLR